MLAGVKFRQLGYGDPLIDKNWSYNNLWSAYAAQQKLLDQFKYANDLGFKIIYDSIRPTFDASGKLTLDNNGYNGDIWPLYNPSNHIDRISIYNQQISINKFTFICQIEWPDPISQSNIQSYCDFFISLITNVDFGWIQNWQVSDTPEAMVNGKAKVSPSDYVEFLSKIRTATKIYNSNINIGGPGIYKSLGLLDPSNPLWSDTSFDHNWLTDAINCGLLSNIDFFSTQLRQDTAGLEYDRIFSLILSLKGLINDKINKDLPIYSINQGTQNTYTEDSARLADQSFYNVSQMLNSSKNGIIPILNEMVDTCDNTTLNPHYAGDIGYGILRYDMSKKPEYDTLKFVLNNLSDYSVLTVFNKLYNNDKAMNISFISNNKEDIISVIWSKEELLQTIVILPNPDEYYLTQAGDKVIIVNPYEWKASSNFLIVVQHLNLSLINYDDIKSQVFKQYMYNSKIKNRLLDSVPVGYNKTSDDTNFYKFLRATSLELADAEIQVDALSNNAYLDTAQKDAIFQNFGTLVDLDQQSDWDYEKYRRLIQGVIKSLLTGPTVTSITDAINLFINYDSIFGGTIKIADITIHELFNDKTLDPAIYDGIYPQFAFVVEVNKNISVDVDQVSLNKDLKYIVNILKPAHTLSFVIIILSGEEDYKEWYYDTHIGPDGLNLQFKDSDQVIIEGTLGGENGKKEGIYGWKHQSYPGAFHTFDPSRNMDNSKTNGPILIGPRYTLYDNSYANIILEGIDAIDIRKTLNSESSVLRFGLYKDNNDLIIDQTPVIIPLSQRDANVNPDSGEYYKNWWLKYHKVKKDTTNMTNLNGKNILENSNLKIILETDVTKGNVDLMFSPEIYIDNPTVKQTLPMLFMMNKTLLPTNQLIQPKEDVAYNIKYFTAPLGIKDIALDSLPQEIKYRDRFIAIGPTTHEIELGNLPFSNSNPRLLRNDSLYGNLYFENMDQTENCELDIKGETILVANIGNVMTGIEIGNDSVTIGTTSENYRNTVIYPYMNDIISKECDLTEAVYNLKNNTYEEIIEIVPEFKVGYNPFIYTLNKTIFPIYLPDQPNATIKPLGFGCSYRDSDVSMEMYRMVGNIKVDIIPLTNVF